MITNNYLFASQFVNFLKTKTIDAETLQAFKKVFVALEKERILNKESEILDLFIKPVLNLLEFAYGNFIENSLKNGTYIYLYDGYPLQRKVSCLYIVGANNNIDSTTKGSFPAFELIHLLIKEKLEWGILTDGKKWRLYSTLNTQPYENYFEINFSFYSDIDFQAFYHLFSVLLFIPDQHQITKLEDFIETSEKEARIIENHLKLIINEILETISYGFLTHSGKINTPLTEEEKQEYFNNSVYLLFRLLFIFYAESRKLLPVESPEYEQVSLESMLATSKSWFKDSVFENEDGTDLWVKFRELCINIDQGSSFYKIPEYDGGLFDIVQHPFLNDPDHQLTNKSFAKVLYSLGYFTKGKNIFKIDYRDLSVRSLGTLYEGILEYRLFIAKEDLVLRDKKFIPKATASYVKKNEREIPAGHVYFSQDAEERHDSGSYYTPEDVVNYIVNNSVRLGLEERWIDFLPTVKKLELDLKSAYSQPIRNSLLKRFDNDLLNFVNSKVLTFHVIDPAMGSGHFLVDALHCITHFILEVLSCSVEISDSPIKHEKNPVPIDWALFHRKSDLSIDPGYWRRKVVESCIFGIDLNPLATELSKLALWIASSSEGKPLAFLNHHLKKGDSIMGIRIDDILRYPENRNAKKTENSPKLFDKLDTSKFENVKARFSELLTLSSDDISDVFSKKNIFLEIESDKFISHLKDIASLWLMISFDLNKIKSKTLFDSISLPDEEQYFNLLEQVQNISDDHEWKNALGSELYHEIKKFNHDKSVFHWDLEFPEIISIGFDVAIGNPPYVDVQAMDYLGLSFLPLSSTNLYSYILTKTYHHKSSNYKIGFIVPMSILVSDRMLEFRKRITQAGKICFINIDSTSHPGTLFKNVNTQISIIVSKDSIETDSDILMTNYYRFYADDRKLLFKNIFAYNLKNDLIKDEFYPKIQTDIEANILAKLFSKQKNIKSSTFSKKDEIIDNENYFYYKDAGNPYYRMAFANLPFLEVNGKQQVSTTTKKIILKPNINKSIPICVFHSSLFYWFWIVYSDCYHFTIKDLERFPIDLDELRNYESQFINIYNEINKNLEKTGSIVTYQKKQGITRYMEYKPRYSKHMFDQVDRLLADYYGLTDEEFNFVITYDLKFRTDELCQENN